MRKITYVTILLFIFCLSFETPSEGASLSDKNSNIKSSVRSSQEVKKTAKKRVSRKIAGLPADFEGPIPAGYYENLWRKYSSGEARYKRLALASLRDIVAMRFEENTAHFYLGIIYFDKKEFSMSATSFKNALDTGFTPKEEVYIRLAEAYKADNNRAETTAAYKKALEIYSDIPSAWAWLGEESYRQNKIDEAFEMLNKAYALDESDCKVLKYLGFIYFSKNDCSKAVELLTQALKADSKDPEIYLTLGKAYEKLGRSTEASEYYLKAKKLGKDNDEILNESGYALGRTLLNSGDYKGALSAFRAALKTSENKGEGYFGMGETYEAAGDSKQALKYFIKAFEEDKSKAYKLNSIAENFASHGKYEEAEKLYKLLKKSDEYKDQAVSAMAAIESSKDTDKRIELERKVSLTGATDKTIEEGYLELYDSDKKNSDAIEGLMRFYRERGYYKEALKWFRRYNKICPVSDYEKKSIERGIKDDLERDNIILYGKKTVSASDEEKSSLSDDEVYNVAFGDGSDRLRENALIILSKRKNYKEDRSVHEELLNFYVERGNRKEALKCVTKMKRMGFLTDSEADSMRSEIKGN